MKKTNQYPILKIMRIFKTKSKAEQIEETAENIVLELFMSKYKYEDIAVIINLAKHKTKQKLELRQKELDIEQLELNNSINLL